MADAQGSTFETTTSTKNLLPVELTIHDHYGRETQCVLRKLPAILGRDEHADARLTDPWISHRHCEIDQIGHVLVVRDLHSKNGIFIHGHRVRETPVLSGELITVGRTKIIMRYQHSYFAIRRSSDRQSILNRRPVRPSRFQQQPLRKCLLLPILPLR